MNKIRAPICVVVGHVDHGKTTLLDFIRKTNITKSEAGGITQAISSTTIPIQTIRKISGKLIDQAKIDLKLPGLLFLDTPGHAAFNNLRKRGGNLADIAILVIDITEGVMPQTLESINILKQYKTPFIVAANKIDKFPGYLKQDENLLNDLNSQTERIKYDIDQRLYELVGKLSELGFNAERFDRVSDYTSQIAIIPIAGLTGHGVPELLMVLSGLAQKYLEQQLKTEVSGPGKATILEVKEEKGIGTALDIVLYDGTISVNDQIVIGGIDEPIVAKIRSMFQANKGKLEPVKQASAAIGLKISAPNLKDVISGMPLQVANNNLEEIKKQIQEEIGEVLIETDKDGIVVKADSLGSLEALTGLLKEEGIKIKKATIGNITKKDLSDAESEIEPLNKVILGFNTKVIDTHPTLKIITHNIIYKIIDDYKAWKESEIKKLEQNQLKDLVRPCKMQILSGCIFRQSNPAIVGVNIMNGLLKTNTPIMKDNGDNTSEIKSIQIEGENVSQAEQGKDAAVSIPHITVGRQIDENMILYSNIPEEDFTKLKKLKKYLNPSELQILKEIALIKRKKEPLWGI